MTVVYRITGLGAALNGIPCVKQWKMAIRGLDTVSACSASDGAVLRTDGNADWKIVALGYGLPPKFPGESFTFTGSDRNGQGWQSSANGSLVSKARIICPTKTGRHIYWQMTVVGNGSLAKGAYSASDATTPAPLNCKGLPFYIDGAAVNGVEGWDLDIDGNETDPVWASDSAGWPKRDPGNIDATITWDMTFDAMSQIPAINSFHQYGLYVTASTFYDVKWAQLLDQPVEYEIEGTPPGKGEYIRMVQAQAKFSGYNGGVKGYINKPGAVAYWPT